MSHPDQASDRIAAALEIAQMGSFDGAHHKMWAIDQMVRALTGCPTVQLTAKDRNGSTYTYEGLGESDEYRNWVAAQCAGEDGPETYEWDVGIAP